MTKQTEKSLTVAAQSSAIVTMAERFGVEGNALFLTSLKNVAFKAPNVTNEQLMALVVVANQYKLNPFTRELYAFPDRGGGIVPIVSIDGWLRIINEQPQLDGIEYREGIDDDGKRYGEATVHRKDRTVPTVVREYLHEVQRSTDPWKQHTHRMLRHKTYIQAARVAFGFAGIYEPDEADRILQSQRVVSIAPESSGAERVSQLIGLGHATASKAVIVEDDAPPSLDEDGGDDEELPL
jgi:phage recombination protein Bet